MNTNDINLKVKKSHRLRVKIEGKTPKEITLEINEGKWDSKFN